MDQNMFNYTAIQKPKGFSHGLTPTPAPTLAPNRTREPSEPMAKSVRL